MKRFGLYAGPILALIIFLSLSNISGLSLDAKKILALASWMVLWWMTEAIPLAVTALIPALFFPLLCESATHTALQRYADPLIFLFLGGFFMGHAMQKWNLHKRLALMIMLRIGNNPKYLVLGIMCTTAFISMWVSNTATVLMMLPLVVSLLHVLNMGSTPEEARPFQVCMMIGLAYSATLGGLGTLIGTPPNAFFSAYLEREVHATFSFQKWFFIGFPLVCILVPLAWFMLCYVIFPIRLQKLATEKNFLDRELQTLGPLNPVEWKIIGIFLFVSMLWMTSSFVGPLLKPWLSLSDSGIALFGMMMMFAFRANSASSQRILEWSDSEKIPWGILLLFGGGLALAEAMKTSGLTEFIGGHFGLLRTLPLFWTILLLVALVTLFSEIASNTATVAAFLPMVDTLARSKGIEPVLLLLPTTLAASLGFMLPIATPANTIASAYSLFTSHELRRAGLWMNGLGILIVAVYAYLLRGFF